MVGSVSGPPRALIWGGEASLHFYASEDDAWGAGGFVQVQGYERSGAEGMARFAAGLQAGSVLGIELGVDHRGADATHRETSGLHVGAYLSLGLIWAAYRVSVPLASGQGRYKQEEAFVVGLKFPIQLGHPSPNFNRGHGRPLRVGEEAARVAEVVVGKGWG